MSIVIEPLVTEKSVSLATVSKYIFEVDKKATKNEIKKEIARIFKVKVKDVNILYQREKERRRGKVVGKSPGYKKAIITLKKGEKIKELEVK